MPEGMKPKEYDGYVYRAEFTPFATRTAEGTHGLMFGKQLSLECPDNLKVYLENIDGKGNDLYKFTNDVVWDCMITGWGGILIDAPFGEDVSQALGEELGIYPYCTFYRAEDIINVRTKTIGRKEVVVLVVLKETEEVETVDVYTTEIKNRYRVLELDENGFYKESVTDEYGTPISEVYPRKKGSLMTSIPFYFLPNKKPIMPMFKPVIDVNLSWYHKSADLENGLHWTGCPTPYVLGYTPETRIDETTGQEVPVSELKLGGSQIVYLPQGTSAFNYLEFSGSGLSQLANAMEKDEERMAILGARIISQEKKGVESAETARIHRAGENSVIATFANECSKVITNVVRDMLEWTTGTEIADDITVAINTDYDISTMSAQELTALVSLWQSGGISKKILFKNLKEGEIIPNEVEFDDMEEEIEEEKEKQKIVKPFNNE